MKLNNREFYYIPNHINPKIIISKDIKIAKNCKVFFEGNGLKKKIFMWLMKLICINENVFNYILYGKQHHALVEDNVIKEIILKLNHNKKLQLSNLYNKYVGGIGLYKKSTIQIFNDQKEIFGYLKISNNQYSKKSIKNEASILEYINSKIKDTENILVPEIPEIIDYEEYDNYFYLLQSSYVLGVNSYQKSDTIKVSMVLSSLYTLTAGEKKEVENSNLIMKIYQDKGMIDTHYLKQGCFDNNLKLILDVINNTLNDIKNRNGRNMIQSCINHNDFTPWNIKVSAIRIYIFDWEWAELNGLPLLDLYHFIVMPLILRKRIKKEQKIIKCLYSLKNIRAIKLYSSYARINFEMAFSLLQLYFVKNIIFYFIADIFAEKDIKDDILLNTQVKLLSYVNNNSDWLIKEIKNQWEI